MICYDERTVFGTFCVFPTFPTVVYVRYGNGRSNPPSDRVTVDDFH